MMVHASYCHLSLYYEHSCCEDVASRRKYGTPAYLQNGSCWRCMPVTNVGIYSKQPGSLLSYVDAELQTQISLAINREGRVKMLSASRYGIARPDSTSLLPRVLRVRLQCRELEQRHSALCYGLILLVNQICV